MLKTYDKISEAERRAIKNWQISIAACYLAGFLGLVALVVVNFEITGWAAGAMQADMTGAKAEPVSTPTRITSFDINAPYP
jgi:hypothetical protein